jgi:two-component system sensor histidine kinase TctE
VIEAAETYAAERISLSGIQLVQALDPMIRPVKADRSLLQYVFFSMIANAIHYLNGVGVVTIVSETGVDGAVEVKVSTIGSEGPLDKRREHGDGGPAARLNRAGTGLPLPVVRDIIEGQGGKMSWEDDGAGELKFAVSFPGPCGG